jgi:hypothetical protein
MSTRSFSLPPLLSRDLVLHSSVSDRATRNDKKLFEDAGRDHPGDSEFMINRGI